MEAIQSLSTAITALTTNNAELTSANAELTSQLATYEEDAKTTNQKIRDLYGKFVALERDFTALIKPKESIFESTQDLLWEIEEKLKDVEPEIAHNGRADDLESILNFTRKSLREMITNEVQKRELEVAPSSPNLTSGEAIIRTEATTSSVTSASSSSSTTSLAHNDAKLEDILKVVIANQGVDYDFVEELLSFKGVYLTGSVVLKTLINQEYEDHRYWTDVVVIGGNHDKIEKCIENGGYKCVAVATSTKYPNKEWTRKIYRKSGNEKNVDLFVYYHRPIAVKYRTEVGHLNISTFMLPFQFNHNFYDGINFFVLNKKALRTKTHYCTEVPKGDHVRKYETAGFKFEVVEKLGSVSFTKKIFGCKTFTDLATEISDKWCKDDIIVKTVKCVDNEPMPEIKDSLGCIVPLDSAKCIDKEPTFEINDCVVPMDSAGNVGENFKKIIERHGFTYSLFEKLFDAKAVATGSAVTQALLGEYWNNCHTVTIDASALSSDRRLSVERLLLNHGFFISHALNNKFGGYVVIYKLSTSSTSRIALKITNSGGSHPMMFNQNTFDGTSFKISAYESIQKRMHYQNFLTSDFTYDWMTKYKERGFEVISHTNPFLHLSSFSIDKSQIPISTQ
jgi:hypothetical protein